MVWALVLLEGLVMSFWLLLVCVVGIKDGPAGLAVFYEQEVQDRAVELGLTTRARIAKTASRVRLALFLPMFTVVPLMVYGLNGARGFRQGFLQMTAVFLIMNLFDRLFIDWFWVGKTKAWEIPGTEDLKPYIPPKALLRKWLGTMVGFPLMAALIAGILQLLGL